MIDQATPVRPLGLAYASRTRLMSIHDGEWEMDARLGTFTRSCLPWRLVKGTRNFHSFDVVITGDNPLLAAILLRNADARGLAVAVTMPSAADDWPYDLAASKSGGSLLLSSLRVKNPPDKSSNNIAHELIKQMVASCAHRAAILPGGTLGLSEKHPDGEVALYPATDVKTDFLPPIQANLAAAFRSASYSLRKAICLPDKKTAVFTRRLVLTAMPKGFCSTKTVDSDLGKAIQWDNPRIVGLGTACTDTASGEDSAKMLVKDIVMAARGLPFSNLD